MSIENQLKERNLPSLLSREEMIDIMQREVYGYLPSVDFTVSVSEPASVYDRYMIYTVEHSYITMTVTVGEKSHSFRVDRLLHTDGKRRPTVILNNFHPIYASRYFPIEELTEKEVDFISCVYEDVCADNGDFENGLAPLLLPNGQTEEHTSGKIGIWAWANMRLVDYALTLPSTDPENICVMGHSRLGKTALFTAMMDDRIKFVFSNASGCSGDSLSIGNTGHNRTGDKFATGELISDITGTFPYWFCKNYFKYVEKNVSDTFDQHFLLASIAPRYVLVGACSEDHWADPVSEQLCALAASEAWEKEGLIGLEDCDRIIDPGEALLCGHVGFFKIKSVHYLSRHCYTRLIEFIEHHKK
ncbi:MAG: hypothetical protein IJX51_06895 [Clostridia bacterium]|nr:hypothetical protein [Clostridia bacterium]